MVLTDCCHTAPLMHVWPLVYDNLDNKQCCDSCENGFEMPINMEYWKSIFLLQYIFHFPLCNALQRVVGNVSHTETPSGVLHQLRVSDTALLA